MRNQSLRHFAGLGIRTPHIQEVLDQHSPIPWWEVLIDNWLSDGGMDLALMDEFHQRYPITFHGVGLSIGSTSPLNLDYLAAIKNKLTRWQPLWYSEHLCFCNSGNQHTPDLLPLPYTEEALDHCVQRITQIQDILGQQLVIENVSSYVQYRHQDLSEPQFLYDLASLSDCLLLCDVNNVFVSSHNHSFDPKAYLRNLPANRIQEIHLAGYKAIDGYLLDSHSEEVTPPVWDLYEYALSLFGSTATLIEWDSDIPPLIELVKQQTLAQQRLNHISRVNERSTL